MEDIHSQILLYGFLIAVIMGAVANKTNFCTMGAVSDWVNMGSKGRLWAWLSAIAVALAGTLILERTGMVTSLDSTLPPYRTPNFAWVRYILGGFMFGIGMTLAGGCGNKTLLNIGGGNLKSLFVLVVTGFFAYLMTKTNFYANVFHSWISATTINLADHGMASQSIPDMITGGGDAAATVQLVIGIVLVLAILFFAFRDQNFRGNFDNPLAGLVIGLCIVGAWYITGSDMGQTWMSEVEWMDNKPLGVGVQSYTFINPMGETLFYLSDPSKSIRVTFGVTALAGIILGSTLYAILVGRFSFVWFKTKGDFFSHLIGGTLMGIGGVLAMGCTIGQGITGVSTLALGSVMALVSIIFGGALTMKVMYYKMIYDDASFMAALLSSLVDLKLLPNGMRKLEAL